MTPSGKAAIPLSYTGAGQSSRVSNGTTGYQYDESGLASTTASSSSTYFTTGPDGDVLSERIPGRSAK